MPDETAVYPAPWPPAPIRTERLVLREPEAGDRARYVELLVSPEVGTYLGGPKARDQVERDVPGAPERRPGLFVVERAGALIGTVMLYRRAGQVERAPGKIELGYLFLPQAWGHGYAAEGCAAALDWLDGALPDEPVVLATQTANARSMRLAAKLGFVEVERFQAWGAQQWFGERPSASGRGRPARRTVAAR
ncbi:GNAT family N-acetyltransferase [Kitasatospora sp. NPDC058965]|uniref:GNAT family N-acetyltransferase n=1 Tax=Kitasatospora sp. NPDC058965 TaxID=3346682 RepID=UPI003685E5C7